MLLTLAATQLLANPHSHTSVWVFLLSFTIKDSMLCTGGQKGGIFPAILSQVWQEGSQCFMDTTAGCKAIHSKSLYTPLCSHKNKRQIGAAVQQQKGFGFDRPHGYKPHSTLTVGSNLGQETESSVPVIMNKCSLENLCM